jgi:hypothetical protein
MARANAPGPGPGPLLLRALDAAFMCGLTTEGVEGIEGAGVVIGAAFQSALVQW